jgi:diguanylate cyclase (GGDEF)-like protein
MKIYNMLQTKYRPYWVAFGFLLLFMVGILDYSTGTEISFSLFYVFPIVLITLTSNWQVGILSSLVGAVLWFAAEMLASARYSHQAILYWNTAVRLSIFLLVSYSIKLGKDLEREASLARTDFVTDVFNPRYFNERLKYEIDRISRYTDPFTIAYLDVDNFKTVNDRFGHSTGDSVLRAIASDLKKTLRKTDIVARVGGDEFALLLIETNEASARVVIKKACESLLAEMANSPWDITISMGVVTFNQAPKSVDEALDAADKAMYEVKTNGKNNVVFKSQ